MSVEFFKINAKTLRVSNHLDPDQKWYHLVEYIQQQTTIRKLICIMVWGNDII